MQVARQLLKEFWLPFLGAASWTLYNKPTTLAQVISLFGSAFLFLSYFTSQLFRVKKQSATEASLRAIRQDIQGLLVDLKAKTDDLVGHVNGGDSYCELGIFIERPGSYVNAGLMHRGAHPLYDLRVRICDLVIFGEISEKKWSNYQDADIAHKSIPLLLPNHAHSFTAPVSIDARNRYSLNIFYQARNGTSTQLLRGALVNGIWVTATRITYGVKNDQLRYEHVHELFPRNENGEVGWD